MSTQAIAGAVGGSLTQTYRDTLAAVSNETPEPSALHIRPMRPTRPIPKRIMTTEQPESDPLLSTVAKLRGEAALLSRRARKAHDAADAAHAEWMAAKLPEATQTE